MPLADTSACTHAKTPTQARTRETAQWTDLIIQAEQLNLTEEQAPKRKHEKNIKGLFARVV